MRIVGWKAPTPEEQERLDRPVKTDRWFDHHGTRCWVVQSLNADGCQVGDSIYVHQKSEAIRQQKFREAEIANWKPEQW